MPFAPDLRLASALLASLALAACGGKETPAKGAAAPADDHGHSHEAPHGGELQELGAEEAHLELMHDHDGGHIAAYAYGKTLAEPVAIGKPTITVQLKEGGTAEVELTAIDPKPDGTAMGWKGQHAALICDPWVGRIRLTVNGKSHQVPLEGPAHSHK